jgi:V8-like Glu-specific endopeptidase
VILSFASLATVFLGAGFVASSAQAAGGTWNAADMEWPSWMTERRIIGTNNLEPVVSAQTTESYDLAKIVARLETPDGMGYCSGSRVGSNLFLTNFHCQESMDCENIVVHMGFERGTAKEQQGVFQCTKILASNETYDYALIEVSWVGNEAEVEALRREPASSDVTESIPANTNANFKKATAQDFPVASLYVGSLTPETPIMVASHPRGRLKEIDQSGDCKIISTEVIEVSMRQTMTHSCDTEGGSSGSPVISRKNGAIVGLHWGGVTEHNFMIPLSSVVEDLESQVSSEVFAQLSIIRS